MKRRLSTSAGLRKIDEPEDIGLTRGRREAPQHHAAAAPSGGL
ncbi:hypothetical protein [Gordonia pseudamarae]|nr:hypothetical protein [Gordonia pseudamarae]